MASVSSFRSHINKAIWHWNELNECKRKARLKGKAPSTACLKHRSKAVDSLNKAISQYHDYRKKQRGKGKWVKGGAEDRYFAKEVARVSALLYPNAATSLTTEQTASGTRTGTSSTATATGTRTGTVVTTSRVGTPVLATASLPSVVESVVAELPVDPITGAAEVATYQFEPASEADLLAASEGEEPEPEGIIEKMKNRPLLSVAAVVIVGGVIHTIWKRM